MSLKDNQIPSRCLFGAFDDVADIYLGEHSCYPTKFRNFLSLDGDTFKISGAAGSGAYAKVFVATKGGSTSSDSSAVALKVRK